MGRFDDAAARVAARENEAQLAADAVGEVRAELEALLHEFGVEANRRRIPTRWFHRSSGGFEATLTGKSVSRYEVFGYGWLLHTEWLPDDRSPTNVLYVLLSDGQLNTGKEVGHDARVLSAEPVRGWSFERIDHFWSNRLLADLEESCARLLAWDGRS